MSNLKTQIRRILKEHECECLTKGLMPKILKATKEWAEGCVSEEKQYPKWKTSYEEGYVDGHDSCRDTTLKNIRGKK